MLYKYQWKVEEFNYLVRTVNAKTANLLADRQQTLFDGVVFAR